MLRKMLDKNTIDAMIYHSPCSDGFTAMTCMYSYAKKNNFAHEIDYIEGDYSKRDTDEINKLIKRVKGKNLVVCDFSYNYETIQILIKNTASFLIIDHHKTAEEDLKNLDSKYKIFDMNRSGAKLMWDFLFENSPAPMLVNYVQDRDLFHNKLPHINEFVAWFYNEPFDISLYEELLLNDDKLMSNISTKGVHYKELNDIYIDKSSMTDPTMCLIESNYYLVGHSNTKILKSDVGAMMLQKYPLLDFSVCYSIDETGSKTYCSLRSNNNSTDVSIIAKKNGGGGHRNASALELNSIQSKIPCKFTIQHLYNTLINAKFDLNKYNIVYVDYDKNYKVIHKYILGPRDTTNPLIKQQAQHMYSIISNDIQPLPLFDICISVRNEFTNDSFETIFYVDFYSGIKKETKMEFINEYNVVCNIITFKGNKKRL